MYSSEAISAWFVNKGIDTSNYVTQMKVQKVVFFAQGLCLAFHGFPIVNEEFEAWKYGPVLPKIYRFYNRWGSMPITKKAEFGLVQDGNEIFGIDVFPDNIEKILDLTWEATKNVDAAVLSGWTHIKGSPWDKHYIEGKNNRIPNEEIKAYFLEKVIKKKDGSDGK
ncbi:MAG: DUF4065 domain-containing protein [Bacteroidetes bacterium]|nr:MAG: DUF4065 domain-containing protein [Bacteroidota bacterium]